MRKTLFIVCVMVGATLGMQGVEQHKQAREEKKCPICMEVPIGENALVTTPCCRQKLCRECLGQLETKHRRDREHYGQEYKACPYCRADITVFVREHGIQSARASEPMLSYTETLTIISEEYMSTETAT